MKTKRQLRKAMLVALLAAGSFSGISAKQYCGEELTHGDKTIFLSYQKPSENTYTITIDGNGMAGLSGSFFTITKSDNSTENVDMRSYVTTNENNLIVVTIESYAAPIFFTPLYIMMDGEKNFGQHTDITWGVCEADTQAPIMGEASLVNTGYNSAVINVAATDNERISSYVVSADNYTEKSFAAVNGKITITELAEETAYNFTIKAKDNSGNVSANSATVSATTVKFVEAPTTAAPTADSYEASNVISIFTDRYTNIEGTNFNPDWGQATTYEEVEIEGNKTLKYSNLNYQGMMFTGQELNANYELHFNLWTATASDVKISLINKGPDEEKAYALNPALGSWNTYKISIKEFVDMGMATNNVPELKFEPGNGGTIYVDNIMFVKVSDEETETPKPENLYCNKPLVSGANTVFLSCEKPSANNYKITIEGTGMLGTSGTHATITAEDGASSNVLLTDYLTVEEGKLIINLVSYTDPIIFTPLYVMMPTEVNFGQLTDITWGVCEADTQAPVMGEASLVSTGYNSAVINVAATDNERVSSYIVSANNYTEKSFAAVNGKITITELAEETTYDFTIKAKDNSGNVSANSATVSATTIKFVEAPTSAAPTADSYEASKVISIFNDSYTNIEGTNFNPDWGQATTYEEVEIAGNKTIKYSNLNYQGMMFTGQALTENYELHFNLWTSTASDVKISLINKGPDEEKAYALNPALGSWNTYKISIKEFVDMGMATNNVPELKFEPGNGGTIYVDNIYFYKGDATSINNTADNQKAIYPNPTSGIIFVDAQEGEVVSVYNITGQLVKDAVVSNGSVSISELNNGFYLVKVNGATQSILKK